MSGCSKPLFLLDANVLIDAFQRFYPMDRIPEYWEWIESCGSNDDLKIPREIYRELTRSSDDLAKWLKDPARRKKLELSTLANAAMVQTVLAKGYNLGSPTTLQLETMGRDPLLVAAALEDPTSRIVVTSEVSKPKKKLANRHIPDVCNAVNVKSIHPTRLLIDLDFRT